MLRKIVASVFFLAILSACSQGPEPPARILIIGSSLIENHGGMDTHLEGLASSRQPSIPIEGRIVERGGASLSDLWDEFNTRKAFEEGPWTYVVLQEIALKGEEFNGKYDRKGFFEHVRLFHEENQNSGAETTLFMFWENRSMNIEEISTDHFQIASELGIKVAPVGLAWQESFEQRPDLELYHTDKVHSNIYGNYLAAAVLYATIFEESPEGLPYTPDDFYGEANISPEDLAYLQGIAWETVLQYVDFGSGE